MFLEWSAALMGLSIAASDSASFMTNFAGMFFSRRKSTSADCRRAPNGMGARLPLPSAASGQPSNSSSIRVITCTRAG